MKRPSLCFVLLAALPALPACLGLSRDAPEQHHFALEASRADAQQPAAAGALEVRPFYVAENWAGKPFVYRLADGELATDFYHDFLVAPGAQITHACEGWLQRAGIFAIVRGGGSRLRSTYTLEAEVTELCGDYRGTPNKAVLAVHAVLFGPDDALLLQKDYRVEEPAAAGAAALVQAWNRALAQLLGELEADLRARLAPADTGR